jgi:hypothetical protein
MMKFIYSLSFLFFTFPTFATCMKEKLIECESEKDFITISKIQCSAPRGPIHKSLMIEYHFQNQYFFHDLEYQEPSITYHHESNEILEFSLEAGARESNYIFFQLNSVHRYFMSKATNLHGEVLFDHLTPYELAGFSCK